MDYIAVIGAVFMDIKGVPFGKYDSRGFTTAVSAGILRKTLAILDLE